MSQQRIEYAYPGQIDWAVAWVAPGMTQAKNYIAKLAALNPRVVTRLVEVTPKKR